MKTPFWLALLLFAACGKYTLLQIAWAQSSPNLQVHQVLTAAQLNALFQGKIDTANGAANGLLLTSPTIDGFSVPAEPGAANSLATLDGTGRLSGAQLPANVITSGTVLPGNMIPFGTTSGSVADGGVLATAQATANTALQPAAVGVSIAPLVAGKVPSANLGFGTTTGTVGDGGTLATTATTANAANTSVNSISAKLTNNLTGSSIPACGNFQSSGWCGWEVNVPLVLWNVSTMAPQFAGLDVVFDQSLVTGNNNVSAINVQTTVGPNDPGQVVGLQSIIRSSSTVAGSQELPAQFVSYRMPGNEGTVWGSLSALHDQTGMDSIYSTGGDIGQENALTAWLGDNQANLSMWGGKGVRVMAHDSFNIENNPTNTFQGSISGTTLTTTSYQNLLPGMVLGGAGLSSGPTVLSGTSPTFQLSASFSIPTNETMTATPPAPASVFFAAGIWMDTGTGAGVGSFYAFANGPTHTGSHGWNGLDCRNVYSLAPLSQFNCIVAASNQNIELDGDGANTASAGTPSLSSGPQRAISYDPTLGGMKYFISNLNANAFTVLDNGMFNDNFGLTISDGGGTVAGHIIVKSTAKPTISGCTGCSLDANASDVAGTITEGTSQTGVVLTFEKPFGTVPHCNVTPISALATSAFASDTPSTTALTIANGSMSNTGYTYECIQ